MLPAFHRDGSIAEELDRLKEASQTGGADEYVDDLVGAEGPQAVRAYLDVLAMDMVESTDK
eukprot:scaffold2364_cov335-Pinguiococcus_pyrenoidosus.AAC.8